MPMLASQSAGGVWEEAAALRTTVGPGGGIATVGRAHDGGERQPFHGGEARGPSTPPHPAGRAVDVLPT